MGRRVAFVTGGGGGIGGETARRLALDGRAVAVGDLDLEAARAVADQIVAAGGDALAVPLDVTDSASVDAAVARTVEALGPVDILVNVAGWDRFMPFLETDEAFWERVIDINYTGVLRTTRAVLPGMVERGWGRIVNTASDAGRVGSSLESVYSGAKGGVIAFTKTIAREVAKKGVTANTVCPGPTDTTLLNTAGETLPDGGQKLVGSLGRAIPVGRVATPADVAPALVFFASEDAGFITGQTLSASGGLTMV